MPVASSTDPTLSTRTRSFIAGVATLTGIVLAYAFLRGPLPSLQLLAVWFSAFLIGEVMRFRTPTGKGNVSMAITMHLAAVPIVPMAAILPAAWLARMVADLIVMRARWYRGVFNAGQVTLAVFAAAASFHFILPNYCGVPPTHYLVFVGALGVSGLAYALVNQGLVTGVLSLVSGGRYLTVWRENFGYRVEIASSTALFLLAPVASLMYRSVGFWSFAAFALPVLFVRDACQRYIELERTQRALIGSERLAAKGEMAASVAHEINNLLQIISGNVELHLRRSKGMTDEEVVRFDRVQDALGKMRGLSKGLLEFSHQESQPLPTDLALLVRETTMFVRPQNRFDGVGFSTETDERVGLVLVDPAQMQQVLTNLLFNAADALKDAGTPAPNIDVRLNWLDSEKLVELCVSDNGPGIPEGVGHRIFEPGYTTKESGHGFGLSTVFRIVKNHKGTIGVHRSPAGGASFVIQIPAQGSPSVLRAA
jgi:signal transduction histidine kinase